MYEAKLDELKKELQGLSQPELKKRAKGLNIRLYRKGNTRDFLISAIIQETKLQLLAAVLKGAGK